MSRSLSPWVMHERNHANARVVLASSRRPGLGLALLAAACRFSRVESMPRQSSDSIMIGRRTGRSPAASGMVEIPARPARRVWDQVAHPPVTAAVESAIWKSVRTDPGGTDRWSNFLLWKQSLDPTRFAHYHPKLGVRVLAQDLRCPGRRTTVDSSM